MFGFRNISKTNIFKAKFTFFVMVAHLLAYLFSPSTVSMTQRIEKIHQDFRNSPIVNRLYFEYCVQRVLDRDKCLFSKPFFRLKRTNKKGEQSKLLSDMGETYKQTKHFFNFYEKLNFNETELKKLPSFKKYLKQEVDLKKQIKIFYQQESYSSAFTPQLSLYFFSFFRSLNLGQLLLILLVSILLMNPIERLMGSGSLIVYYFFIPLICYEVLLLRGASSIAFFDLASLGTYSLLGLTLGHFFSLKFYLKSKKYMSLFSVTLIFLICDYSFRSTDQYIVNLWALHFVVMIASLFIGNLHLNLKGLPKGFYSRKNYLFWRNAIKVKSIKELLYLSEQILKENPDNITVKEDVFKILIKKLDQKEDITKVWPLYQAQFKDYLRMRFKSKIKEEELKELLRLIPEALDKEKILNEIKNAY